VHRGGVILQKGHNNTKPIETMAWITLSAIYDEDFRGGTYRFSHVTEQALAYEWPTTLTLDSAATIQTPPLAQAPLIVLRPHAHHHTRATDDENPRRGDGRVVRARDTRRVTLLAADGTRWEEYEHRQQGTVSRRFHLDPESDMVMLSHPSPIVTYRIHTASGRLSRAEDCLLMSYISCVPTLLDLRPGAAEAGRPDPVERLQRSRLHSIQKQLADQRVVIDLGRRVATYHPLSWRAIDALVPDGCPSPCPDSSI
jgi:hypothetical protein